ncbi:hypothetical protein LRP50_00175 [Enterovibrio sp. ZSDZ42]|uniref:PAS domain-containing protein n=1 Tax=Enterovibrio gelatinilyticus TaxID=2899819 RepID=A0ABT5QU65_9GAMM|nr:hypothetical protein [Enterovibrio sp. ZSDZ42]MDD1791543.1 hypothetical protein [Enterovibrio sp. ZSDZ42]
MNASYSKMLGLTYEELLKNSAFLSAIGGNVPEKISKDSKNFHVLSPSKNISFTFGNDTRSLKFASLSPDSNGCFAFGLTTEMNEQRATAMFGKPLEGRPAQKVPLLGQVGAWGTHVVEGCKLMLMYSADTGNLEVVRFTL